MNIVTINKAVENKIITIRKQEVLLDSDVALLYEVETRVINQAVSRNIDKFPDGYIIDLNDDEWQEVKSQIVMSPLGGGRAYKPRAFTEKGLYMLATILKSPRATITTIAIIETFTRVREATRAVAEMLDKGENNPNAEKLQHKIGAVMSEILTPDINDYDIDTVKTSAKFKFFSMLEFTKEVTRKPKNNKKGS